ncbi:transporter substrate-binding domain-containing protein [Pseudomonas sp. PDNC002]|uniref:substrate-binding periplasmic protein n=1 Tax=Pseudomonas sp. PDNC002 TaxID=2811422 RepID=UPI00196431AE|nr:transporter substrate-binding domain-containing protein [Pseudomonas sp. PDNC002]QRY78422.1 transporter substrate-binding domain-containing protein [Pseudomonas sp. PDNC002]
MRFLATALLLTTALAQADDRPLRFSVVDSWAMPLAQIENGELTGGIMFELFSETARQLGRTPDFHIVPRARIEQALLNHSVDVRCYVSRTWVEHEFNDYRWTAPLMVQRDLLVTRDAPADTLESLSSQSVGTVLGYHYPRLQPLLDSHWLARDDARNQELVLKKLRIGRYQYAISSEFALNWFNRELPEAERLQTASVIEETPLSCMVLNSPDVRTDDVLAALAKMKASGKIEQILDHYR